MGRRLQGAQSWVQRVRCCGPGGATVVHCGDKESCPGRRMISQRKTHTHTQKNKKRKRKRDTERYTERERERELYKE